MIATMTENKQTTDSELLLQVVGYNQSAFEQLYSRYSATIYSLIKEIVSNPKLAEKILLNVFSVFLKRMEFYSTTSNNIFTWLTLLSRNISLDVLKRMKFVEDIPIYSDEYEIEFIMPNLSSEISAINLSERTLLGEKFRSYKGQLTEIQNLVLSLVYFEGLSEEEIAKRLNVSKDAVRQRVLNIMETIYQMHFGKQESNSNKEIVNLIKLEPLGYLSSQERTLFNQIRESDPDFLWEKLGEYQNLVALLSTTIPIEQPPHQLNIEINNIFMNILQGSEVEYPIVSPEPPILKQMPEPLPEVIKLPEIQEKKEKEFQIKFKEQNSNALNELRGKQTIPMPQAPKPEPINVKKDIVIRDQNVVVKKQSIINDKIETSSSINTVAKPIEQIQQRVETLTENKTLPANAKPEVKPGTIHPLVAIEEPKALMVKDNGVIKNKLTPTSSINLKDFFKNSEPVKSDKVIPSPVEKEKTSSAEITTEKTELKIKSNESTSELNQTNLIVQKEEKVIPEVPTSTVVEQSGIKIRSNQPPKEMRRIVPSEIKEEKKTEEKVVLPKPDKPDIVIRSNEPPKEFRRSNQVFVKDQNLTQSKPVIPTVERQELKTAIPPVDSKTINNTVVPESKPSDLVKQIVSEKSEAKVQSNLKPQESPKAPIDVKEIKPVEDKKAVSVIDKPVVDSKAVEVQKPTEEIKQAAQKTEKPFERISTSADRTSLKIRETKFVDKESKTDEVKSQSKVNLNEVVTEKEKSISTTSLNDINIDEILNKIEDEKPSHQKNELIPENAYEEEVVRLRKKLRRNILVSAALFVILIASGVFTYLQMNQSNPTQVSSKVYKPIEDINNSEQVNVAATGDSVALISSNEIVESVNEPLKQDENKEVRVSLPPLPESLTKEESTYFALKNENDPLLVNNKDTKQIAAAKTENIVPPKENKVKEEEPGFFVAVEEMPELIGGIKGLQSRITYPKIAEQTNTEGKVLVQAVVDENGKVISTNVIKGIGAGCDEVALDAVINSKFKPGKQRGKNVKVQVTIPIVFKKQ